MATIRLATREQQILMICELQGQISDGYWESARPYSHWKQPSGATVLVEPDNIGIDFWPQRAYNFASTTLLSYVGDRMLMFAQFAGIHPTLSPEAIRRTDSGEWWWKEEAEWAQKARDEYAAIGINSHAELQAEIARVSSVSTYQKKHLRADLKAINLAFKKII